MSLENPQLEDGHFKIAIGIAEALARTQMSGHESRVLWFLFRKTYGWNKKRDFISLSQWMEGTGLTKSHVVDTLNRLVKRKVIFKTVPENRNARAQEYGFNKHYGEWKPFPKTGTFPKSGMLSFPKTGPTIYKVLTTEKYLKDIVEQSRLDAPLPSKPKRKTKDVNPAVSEVLAYLNQKTGSKYSVAPDLVARFKQGATITQAKSIIDKKVTEWSDTEMAPWLKPSTLFCKKHFDEYLNQPTKYTTTKTQVPGEKMTPEQDVQHRRKMRQWLYDEKLKEEAV
jgi:phage replication O-like protein O